MPERGLIIAFLACCLMASIADGWSQAYDFNNGNDNGWTRFDLSEAGPNPPFPPAVFSFPADGLGGKAYEIFAPVPAIPDAGPARVGSFPAPVYSRFQVAVDTVNWDAIVNQSFGFLIRASNVGIGTTLGYVMNYNATEGVLQLNEVTQEAPTTIAETPVFLNPSQRHYRWVCSGYGDNLLGQVFALPDMDNPVASVVASDPTHASGNLGLFIFSNVDAANYTDANATADATFDNYIATVPTNNAFGAVVVALSPGPGEQVTTLSPLVSAAILDRETTVDINSVQLWVDGVEIPTNSLTLTSEVDMPNNPVPFSGVTVSYQPTSFASLAGVHTNRVVFADNNGTVRTNEWTFTLPVLKAANASPAGSGSDPGFSIRLVQASGDVVLPQSILVAEAQLTVPPAIPAAFSTNTLVNLINFTKDPTVDPAGAFPYTDGFPGIDPSSADYLAMEAVAYLELPAGTNRFGMQSDDGFLLISGASLTDTNGIILGQSPFDPFGGTFNFYAETAGLYPFRLVWFQTRGGAHVQWYSADPATGAPIALINDTSNPASIKAYRTISATSTGPQILNPHFQGAAFVFSFQTQVGKTYTVLSSSTLPTWGSSGIAPISGTGGVYSVNVASPSGSQTFYQIQQQ